ncbi:MAG: AbrB/MazE/SpoVT family DNA-binding domain-containing protein [Actinobacteria bacterium]|nr:AbrB/MazE/SpoVT family DNA-binding domain-containing protein [Actinomycetota bacterium]
MKSTVSEKGQVTIPKPLRDSLGILPGEILDFAEEEGRLVATKVSAVDPVDDVFGIISLPAPTDELIRQLRGPAEM